MCVVDRNDTDVGCWLTLDVMATAHWVLQDIIERTSPVLVGLRAQGVEPHVQYSVGDLHSVFPLVRDRRSIGLVPERMVHGHLAGAVRVVRPPLPTPPLVETLWWHVARTSDPAHRRLTPRLPHGGTNGEPGA